MAAKTSTAGRGFAGMDEDEQREVARRGGQNSHGGRGNDEDDEEDGNGAAGSTETAGRGRSSQGGSKSQGGSSTQATKRVLTRAIRVLNEIESRIEELKHELEEQSGNGSGSSNQGGRSSGSRNSGRGNSGEDDEDETPGGQGRVKHPESDGRLKQNRDN